MTGALLNGGRARNSLSVPLARRIDILRKHDFEIKLFPTGSAALYGLRQDECDFALSGAAMQVSLSLGCLQAARRHLLTADACGAVQAWSTWGQLRIKLAARMALSSLALHTWSSQVPAQQQKLGWSLPSPMCAAWPSPAGT